MKLSNFTFRKAHNLLSDKLGRKARKLFRNKYDRAQLQNTNFTIFSQNCIGSIMYHDLGVQFNSPTINMRFFPKDFILFMQDIHWYLKQSIEFIQSDKPYPVGKLGGVLIEFVHYQSENEVLDLWEKRRDRINWDNVFVLCCDEGLTYDDMVEFDNLPYKNKILFMHYYDPSIKCGVYTKEFKDKTDARLLGFDNIFGKRSYQNYINYVKWINEGNYWS